jgi:inhibitor of cysteine peptidase
MRGKAVIFVAIAMVALFAGACTSAGGSPKHATIEVGYDELAGTKNVSKEITLARDTELIVKLAANPSTGFSWTQAVIAPPSVLAPADSKYMAPEGSAVGAAGIQVWTFIALEKGTTTVKMDYGRPWEGGEKAEWTFQLTVTVR